MSKRIIIGLVGKKGCGKDTFYRIANQIIPFKRTAFADKIKQQLSSCFGIPIDMIDSFKTDDVAIASTTRLKTRHFDASGNFVEGIPVIYSTISGRDFLRNFGMLMRSYDETQFEKSVQSQILSDKESNFCVTDVRFPSEAKLIKDLGGVLVKIESDYDDNNDHHVTESGNFDVNYTIHNNRDTTYSQHIEKLIKQLSL